MELLLGRRPKDIGEKSDPEPQGTFVPGTIAVQTCHLRPVFVAEIAWVEAEEQTIDSF